MIDVSENVLELFNNITLDIRDYLFDRSGQTGEQFSCTNQTYNKSILWLSDRKVTVAILKGSDNNDFVNIYIGNSCDEMLLISTSKNEFTVTCIPNISSYTPSGQNYFTYSWKECELENFIDIARTRFHEYHVKIIAVKKKLDYKLNILRREIEPYIYFMTDYEVIELANKIKNELKKGDNMEYKTPEEVRPKADVKYSFGNDGKDDRYYVSYSCPTCNKKLGENEIACDRCGTFFDWSKKAHLIVQYDVEWR